MRPSFDPPLGAERMGRGSSKKGLVHHRARPDRRGVADNPLKTVV